MRRFIVQHRMLLLVLGTLITVGLLAYWTVYQFKKLREIANMDNMPLVYLIPEDYFGPVVVIFDQPDGQVPKVEPIGRVLIVPDNGLLRVKGEMQLKPSPEYGGRQSFSLSVNAKGERKLLSEIHHSWYKEIPGTDDYETVVSYFDQQNNRTDYRVPEKSVFETDEKGNRKEYFIRDENVNPWNSYPQHIRKQRIVTSLGTCQDRIFQPQDRIDMFESGNTSPKDLGVPSCGEFEVGTLEQIETWPEWMKISDSRHPKTYYFTSVDALEKRMNEIKKHKQEYYKLKPQAPISSAPELPKLLMTADMACPKTGYWSCVQLPGMHKRLIQKGERIVADDLRDIGLIVSKLSWVFVGNA